MTDHPYAGPNTLGPGERLDDDPVAETTECRECDEFVQPIPNTNCCPMCGDELD